MTNRERVRHTIEMALAWERTTPFDRDNARRQANEILNALEAAPANGKATDRFIRSIDRERSA